MGKVSIKNFDKFNETATMNNRTYVHYYERMRLLAISMYSWEGLPDTISKRFIENNLFDMGRLAFWKHPSYGYIVTKCTPSSELNLYDEPTSYFCYSNNGIQENVLAKDCVIIRNNMMEIPTYFLIELFCTRLYNIERTIDVNVNQQKTPVLITCSESQKLTMKNFYMKVDGNEPVIWGNDKLNVDGIKVFKTDAPYIADKLEDLKEKKWNQCLSMLGINNANTNKKERLITNEVDANNQLIDLEAETFLLTRKFACEEIKQKFNLDITVDLRCCDETITEGGEQCNE